MDEQPSSGSTEPSTESQPSEPTEPTQPPTATSWGPPPSGSPSSTVSPSALGGSGLSDAAAAAAAVGSSGTSAATAPSGPTGGTSSAPGPGGPPSSGGGWYSGPWPPGGMAAKESTGSAIGRTAIMSLTALIIILFLPLLFLFGLIFGLIGLGVVAGGGGDEAASSGVLTEYVAGDKSGDTRLVSVPVVGPILGEDRGGGGGFLTAASGVVYGYSVKETLLELADDESVDGVLLELDTPGGTIYGSKAISDGVAEYQERTGNPVLAYVGGVSASGGMYAMAGADEIVADHGTLIGSIGVIFGPFVRYNDIVATDGGILGGGVTTEGGIEYEYLTAGRSKDLGSPYRDLTAEERKTLEESLDNAYDQFVAHVAAGRDLSEAEIKNDLGALIFGEEQAKANGLIDTIGSREVAHKRLAELAGAEGDDWRLDRTLSGDAGFLSLFAGAAADSAGVDPTTVDANLPSVCTGTATLLAYHGDPAGVCAPLLATTD